MKSSFRFPNPTNSPTKALQKTGATPILEDKANNVFIIITSILAALVVLGIAALVIWKLRGRYNTSRVESYNTKKVIVIPVSPRRPFPDEYGARNYHDHVEQQVNIYRPQEYIL